MFSGNIHVSIIISGLHKLVVSCIYRLQEDGDLEETTACLLPARVGGDERSRKQLFGVEALLVPDAPVGSLPHQKAGDRNVTGNCSIF